MGSFVWVWVLEGVALAAVVWGLVVLIRGVPEATIPPARPVKHQVPEGRPASNNDAIGGIKTARTPPAPEKDSASISLADNAQVSLSKATDRA